MLFGADKGYCYVKCPTCFIVTCDYYDVATAIAAWNRRTPPAAVPDAVAAIKFALTIDDHFDRLEFLYAFLDGSVDTDEEWDDWHEYRAMISAAPTPPVDDGWRPIETAPRDGTVIDVWLGCAEPEDVEFYCGPGNTRRAASWHWHKGKFRPAMGLEDAVPPVFVQPTHWRPLPPPPGESE